MCCKNARKNLIKSQKIKSHVGQNENSMAYFESFSSLVWPKLDEAFHLGCDRQKSSHSHVFIIEEA
jgi:hypothetical protein